MAEARKTEKTVTTTETRYVLELSEEEREFLLATLGPMDGVGPCMRVYRALNHPAETAQETPRVGDRVRTPSGKEGTLARVDPYDDDLPYLVEFGYRDSSWVSMVTVLP